MYVFKPVPGVYDNIVPFDFASLYPTTIIAYNIDYSTLVQDRHVPDSHCHVIEWEDHLGCCHDPKVQRLNELNTLINSRENEMKALRTKRDSLTVNSYLPGYVRGKKYTRVQRKGASVLRDRERANINRRIKRLEAALKPYREERADVKKGIPNMRAEKISIFKGTEGSYSDDSPKSVGRASKYSKNYQNKQKSYHRLGRGI